MVITLNPITLELRQYKTELEALEHSATLNRIDEDHPAFILYKPTHKHLFKSVARLYRDFGQSALYWKYK